MGEASTMEIMNVQYFHLSLIGVAFACFTSLMLVLLVHGLN